MVLPENSWKASAAKKPLAVRRCSAGIDQRRVAVRSGAGDSEAGAGQVDETGREADVVAGIDGQCRTARQRQGRAAVEADQVVEPRAEFGAVTVVVSPS